MEIDSDLVLKPPEDKYDQTFHLVTAIENAIADGKTRIICRHYVPRGRCLTLHTSEVWDGGCMQIFNEMKPYVSEVLQEFGEVVDGETPVLKSKRLDESGYEGEGIWIAEGSKKEKDRVAFVMPTLNRGEDIEQFCKDAGPRPVIIFNPQWPYGKDPMDTLASIDGKVGEFFSSVGGGTKMYDRLERLGFEDAYTVLSEDVSGTRCNLVYQYPFGWTASYKNREGTKWIPLKTFDTVEAPSWDEVKASLVKAEVPFYFNEYQ
jgi:hypothetical protein